MTSEAEGAAEDPSKERKVNGSCLGGDPSRRRHLRRSQKIKPVDRSTATTLPTAIPDMAPAVRDEASLVKITGELVLVAAVTEVSEVLLVLVVLVLVVLLIVVELQCVYVLFA